MSAYAKKKHVKQKEPYDFLCQSLRIPFSVFCSSFEIPIWNIDQLFCSDML